VYRGDILPPKKETQAQHLPAAEPVAEAAGTAETGAVAEAVAPAVAAPPAPVIPQMDAAPAQTEVIELVAPEEDELLSALGGPDESKEE
jgi:hypothetical protein